MRSHIALTVLLHFAVVTVSAQSADGPKLTLPSSPAFSILDFEPTAVLRPATNKDLATDLLSTLDKNGKLIANAGLEVSPYWLKSRSGLTRERYLEPDLVQLVKQSFGLSAATVRDTTPGARKLATGFRFKIKNGRPVEALSAADAKFIDSITITNRISLVRSQVRLEEVTTKAGCIQALRDALEMEGSEVTFSEDQILFVTAAFEEAGRQYPETRAGLTQALEATIDAVLKANRQLVENVADLTYQRVGWVVEFAGATGFSATGSRALERVGLWANVSNAVSPTDLLTTTTRYLRRSTDTLTQNADLGIAYLKQTAAYNLSFEAMLRWYHAGFASQQESDFTYRIAAQASHMLGRNISVNLSFGKDFDSPFIDASGFFSILGLNYSLFNIERGSL